jgi:hypothetical protein
MKLIKKLFNSNTGYFLNSHTYYYKEKEEIGYILCRGYVMFGIPGYKRITMFTNKLDAQSALLTLLKK